MSLFLVSCAGLYSADGPPYQETPITNKDSGRIIIYMPVNGRSNTYMYESMVYINNKETHPVSRGGYHSYEVKPGLHLISVRNEQPFEENIVLNVSKGETYYIKYAFNINEVLRNVALDELSGTKLEYVENNPVSPIDFGQKALVTKRDYFIQIEHDETNKSLYESLAGRNDTYIVEPGLQTFGVKVAYEIGPNGPYYYGGVHYSTGLIEKNITTKNNCIYLFSYEEIIKNLNLKIKYDEYCGKHIPYEVKLEDQ